MDPDPQLSEMIRLALRHAGYDVEFDHARERPRRLHEGQEGHRVPDLVLTKLHEQACAGFGLLRDLQAKFPALRILHLCPEDASAEPTALGRGEAVLAKPFTAAELQNAVRRLLIRPAGSD